ncbi:uncharacterized protein LOC103513330 [Diaphorina citri]|uniref:non-specific serine/threonine protein kinase n=1 Tax=Diaphorina citri TaxID=121845 RepID=A0A3Q0J5X9_DIACI|nr:uncharacterized protein LOC103513330 [Diaphorina citri]
MEHSSNNWFYCILHVRFLFQDEATPRRARESSLQSHKEQLKQVEAADEARLVRGQKDYLELEVRKFRRKKMLSLHGLETELLREELNKRQQQLEQAHSMLLRHHEKTQELEYRQQKSVHSLREDQVTRQHQTELTNQEDYMHRSEQELKKKHALELKQQPKSLKQKEMLFRKQFRETCKIQTRQYKALKSGINCFSLLFRSKRRCCPERRARYRLASSLRNKVSMLESLFIDRDRQPSVVCITEHWLASGEEQYCNINDYQIAASRSRVLMRRGKAYGGVLVYVKNNINYKVLDSIASKSVDSVCELVGVEKGSKAEDVGLKRGDQILEVNGQSFQHVSHARALEIFRGTTHLSITVKSNLLEFKQMLAAPDDASPSSNRSRLSRHNKMGSSVASDIARLQVPTPTLLL